MHYSSRRWKAPDNEVPVGVPGTVVLGRSDDAAVFLTGIQAYSTGIVFEVGVRLRRTPRGPWRHRVWAMLNGTGDDDPESTGQLLLGVEYADGRAVANVGFRPTVASEDGEEAAEPMLVGRGGGGGERVYDQSYWLSPLPPPGPLLFVCGWQALGIPETRVTIDGAAVAEARSRVTVLWPAEPEDDQPREPPVPGVPDGSWFAAVVRPPPGPAGPAPLPSD
jgi:hypothetical protein